MIRMKWYKVNQLGKLEFIDSSDFSDYQDGNYFLINESEQSILDILNSIKYLKQDDKENLVVYPLLILGGETITDPSENNLNFTYIYGPIDSRNLKTIDTIRDRIYDIYSDNPLEDVFNLTIYDILSCPDYLMNEIFVLVLSIAYHTKGLQKLKMNIIEEFMKSHKFIKYSKFFETLLTFTKKEIAENQYNIVIGGRTDVFGYLSQTYSYHDCLENFYNSEYFNNCIVIGHGWNSNSNVSLKINCKKFLM
jgi:hypothetical protein